MSTPEQNLLFIFHDFEKLAPTPMSRRLARWPLHLTVTPLGFHLNDVPQVHAVATIATMTRDALPIDVIPGEPALYGPQKDIPVTRIDDVSGELHHFHRRLIHELGALGCQFSDLTYALDHYSPHVSHKDRSPILTDAPYTLDSMTVAAKLPIAKPNKIILDRIEP